METDKRLQALADEVLKTVNTQKDEEDSLLLLCSAPEASLLFLGGSLKNLFRGLSEAMNQREEIAALILDLADAFLQAKEDEVSKEDEEAVAALIRKTLGSNSKPN